jgi:hypothetical protein
MARPDHPAVPAELAPLLAQPAGWQPTRAWRISAAACRASGAVAWAAQVQPPDGPPRWLSGLSPSRPRVIQSECVESLAAALAQVPSDEPVEVICPTSLRYLAQGRAAAPGTPERRLAELAAGRRLWARYALGSLEALTDACLARAYAVLVPLRWPGEDAATAALRSGGAANPYVLYADGGCARGVAVGAWVLRREGQNVAERCWTLDQTAGRDGVRLAEFGAAADGLRALPDRAAVALVTDHVDITDFGVRGEPSFSPSPRVAAVLEQVRGLAERRMVRWYWAERVETEGQRRCQALITRRLQAAHARPRFLAACAQLGLDRVRIPDFARWLAPRGPSGGARRAWPDTAEEWSATFERTERFLAAGPSSPRLYLRQLRVSVQPGELLAAAFARSTVAGWCDELLPRGPLAGAPASYVGHLRSGFAIVALLFDPHTVLLLQSRPGATLAHAIDAAACVVEARTGAGDTVETQRTQSQEE